MPKCGFYLSANYVKSALIFRDGWLIPLLLYPPLSGEPLYACEMDPDFRCQYDLNSGTSCGNGNMVELDARSLPLLCVPVM